MTSVTEADVRLELPARYHVRWHDPFESNIGVRLREGISVLDVGSGRNPTLAPFDRPAHVRYVGLDISSEELEAAGPLAYDQTFVADLTTPLPDLVGTIDLAVSWQVFEHVKPLQTALANLHSYLKPDGTLISLFSGGLSAFAIVNRLTPTAVGTRLVKRSMRRDANLQPVFPAYYDRCTYSALRRMTSDWTAVEIHPLFRGATYFHFSRPLTRAYVAYENAVRRAGLRDLATHYLMIAHR